MPLTSEQEKEIKEQLLKQVEQFPEENREQIKKQINSMTTNQLEEFVKQNQLTHMDGNIEESSGCLFCNITQGKSPSLKIDENEIAIAILDINPISRGHTLIIPKSHKAEATQALQEFAFSVGGKILKELKSKDITTQGTKVGEHLVLNVIPIYEDTDMQKRINITKEELIELQKKLAAPGMLNKSKDKQSNAADIVPIANEDCIFCLLASNKVQSIKVDENANAIAILELTPLTKGHTIIVPKDHVDTTHIPTNLFALAKKIAKKLESKLKATDIKIITKEMGGHAVLDVIPIYEDKNPEKREPADPKDLEIIAKRLRPKQSTPKKKSETKETKSSGLPQFSARIP